MEGLVFKLDDLHRQRIACVNGQSLPEGGGVSFSVTRAPHNVYTARVQFFRIPLSSL